MKGPRGEITVFVSLTMVCVLSLFLGLLESARTAGARLYLRMASDSSMASVMSQYNRNLWEMYQLLFLEYESEAAIKKSFESYLDFYLEQENFYPAKKEKVELTGLVKLTDNGGAALEEEIRAYLKYRLPEVAADIAGITKAAGEAADAGDFQKLFDTCRQAGRKTRDFERARRAVETSLGKMEEWKERLEEAMGEEKERTFERYGKKLADSLEEFPGLVDACERAAAKISEFKETAEAGDGVQNPDASEPLRQEFDAYGQAEEAAKKIVSEYREMESQLAKDLEALEEAVSLISSGEEEETDWGMVGELLDCVQIPEQKEEAGFDREKAAALDRLEELFNRELLQYVVPRGTEISNKRVLLAGIPSAREKGGAEESTGISGLAGQILVNEYVFLYFNSFTGRHGNAFLPEERPLSYEQEYLLCGKGRDRDNLKGTVERLVMLRGAMNLLMLLNSPEKRAEADILAAAVSFGFAPAQMVVSFFILTLWAAGEGILDVKELLAGGGVPFWKTEADWKTSLDGLLSLGFLEEEGSGETKGQTYEDYLRILLALKKREERNFRMMDLIQWNVQTKQRDFSAEACAYQIEMETTVKQKHVFALKNEYEGTMGVTGSYR